MNNITTLILIIISLYLVYYDIKFKKVPNIINLFLLIIVVSNKVILQQCIISPLISGFIAFITFFIIYLISKGKMGIGDAKYTAIIAFNFGYYFWLKSIIYCSTLALIISIILLLTKRIKRDTPIPFMPFLVFGWLLNLFIINFY